MIFIFEHRESYTDISQIISLVILMDELEKIALEAFEKGKEDIFIPQDPFNAFGFDSNPFFETSEAELREQAFLQPRIRKISHYIGKVYSSYSEQLETRKEKNDETTLDGILFGSSQSGLSTLIKFTISLLLKHQNLCYVDAKELIVFEDMKYQIAKSIQNFRNFVGDYEVSGKTPMLVIIDHADYLVSFFEEFRDAFESDFHDIPIVFIFTHSGWARLKNDLSFSDYDIYNKTVQSIEINSPNPSEIASILKQKLSIDSKIQKPFTQRIISYIAEISGESISNAIKICILLCQECYYEGRDVASTKLVNDVSSVLHITKNAELYDFITLKAETETVIRILSLIALKSTAYDYGITYEEIATNLKILKTSASHHLKQLEARSFIKKVQFERRAFYKLRDELRTIIDIYLLPKHEQIEKFVRFESISELM